MSSLSFVDRERELAELARLQSSGDRRLAMLYGRRQIGKTFLLSHAWRDRRVFYFLAADSTADLNRRDLLRDLAAWSGRPLDPADYPTWRTIFRLFVDLTEEGPLVVVLDEFQYLLEGDDSVPSQLVAVWDREARGRPLTVVLSGSEVGTMERLQSGGQPLFGRVNWSARLHAFDYRDAARMMPDRPPREAALLYGIFGGTPRYLAAVERGEPLDDAVVRTFVSPRGEIHLQLLTLIEQERGIRDPAAYRAVLAAVAAGRTEINEIAQGAGLGGQPHVVRRVLGTLENLEIVGRERNFAATATSAYRHHIVDNAVAFWHRFVVPNRSRLATGDPAAIWREAIAPYLNDYIGKVFERLVGQAYARCHATWELPAARVWARWEGRDRNRRAIELDVVARLDGGRMLTGEIKWSSTPRSFELHNDLQRNLGDLANSGHGWAHEALDGGFLYVSAAGFGDDFRRWAVTQPNVHLLALDDLYST
jgi:AAA+ ATPase superfamily predicted ATPase